MPNHGMTPHTSGTSLSAQYRYAAGVREILECFFEKKPIRDPYLIVKDGQLAGMGAHSYSKGSATGGSEEAAKYKKKNLKQPFNISFFIQSDIISCWHSWKSWHSHYRSTNYY